MNIFFAILLIAFIILLGGCWTTLMLHYIIDAGWSNLPITEQVAYVLGITIVWVLVTLVIGLILNVWSDRHRW